MNRVVLVFKDPLRLNLSNVVTVQKWFTICNLSIENHLVDCSYSYITGNLSIILILISSVWDQTLVNRQFQYIYYYYNTSTQCRMKWHGEDIPNPITDTIPNLQVTLYHLQLYFHQLSRNFQHCWCWWCCCCCSCCMGQTACNGRPAHRQNSWESHVSLNCRSKTHERINRMVRMLYKLILDVIEEVIINAVLRILRLCHHWICTSWVDPSANHAADTVYHFNLNHWRVGTNICVETMNYIWACIINLMIYASWITLTLYSTSWTNLWWVPKPACFAGQQQMVNGCHSEGTEWWIDGINEKLIIHFHSLYAIEVWLVSSIHNIGSCRSKPVLIN